MQASPVARVIISISAMLFAGFAMTRITKRFRLPNVTGYILAGILVGPCCLNVIPARPSSTERIFFRMWRWRSSRSVRASFSRWRCFGETARRVIVITVLEACLASVAVFILVYGVLHLELSFSIVLSALASATAPASTMMTIRQTGRARRFCRYAPAGRRAGRRGWPDSVQRRDFRGDGLTERAACSFPP